GSTATPPVAKPPHIPRALAREWAVQANAVADALAARDGCTAVAHANTLRADVDQLQSRIPARLRATLLATVDALPGRITCNPPAPQPHPHDKHPDHPKPPHDHGHGHEH
ncbi:MAG TPA: hypothetical protein VGH92_14310, partial [Gaiellaceae bacterium]